MVNFGRSIIAFTAAAGAVLISSCGQDNTKAAPVLQQKSLAASSDVTDTDNRAIVVDTDANWLILDEGTDFLSSLPVKVTTDDGDMFYECAVIPCTGSEDNQPWTKYAVFSYNEITAEAFAGLKEDAYYQDQSGDIDATGFDGDIMAYLRNEGKAISPTQRSTHEAIINSVSFIPPQYRGDAPASEKVEPVVEESSGPEFK